MNFVDRMCPTHPNGSPRPSKFVWHLKQMESTTPCSIMWHAQQATPATLWHVRNRQTVAATPAACKCAMWAQMDPLHPAPVASTTLLREVNAQLSVGDIQIRTDANADPYSDPPESDARMCNLLDQFLNHWNGNSVLQARGGGRVQLPLCSGGRVQLLV